MNEPPRKRSMVERATLRHQAANLENQGAIPKAFVVGLGRNLADREKILAP